MKKVSYRTERLASSPAFAAKVMVSRYNGLGRILNVLSRGTRVNASAPAVYQLASMKQLF